MDLVEVNPKLGSPADQEVTLTSACKLVDAWFNTRERNIAPA